MYHSVIHILQILGVDVNGPDAIDPAHVKLWQKKPNISQISDIDGGFDKVVAMIPKRVYFIER